MAPYLAGFDWTSLLPPVEASIVVLVVNVANILLRLATTTPVGRRQ